MQWEDGFPPTLEEAMEHEEGVITIALAPAAPEDYRDQPIETLKEGREYTRGGQLIDYAYTLAATIPDAP